MTASKEIVTKIEQFWTLFAFVENVREEELELQVIVHYTQLAPENDR